MTTDRTFRDGNGIPWRVSLIERETISSLEGDVEWLLFETIWMQRRLTPVPDGWERATDYRLEQMCRVAKPIGRYERVRSLTPPASDQIAGVAPTVEPDQSPNQPAGTRQGRSADGISVLADSWPAHDVHITFRG